MSNVAIKGGATGTATYTIEAPTGNTDRTLVLPDEAGTVVTTGGTGSVTADMLNSTLDLSGKTVTLPAGVGGSYVHLDTTSGTTDVSGLYLRHFDLATYKRYMISFRFESDSINSVYFRYVTASADLNGTKYSGFIQARRSDQSSGINTDRFDTTNTSYILGNNSVMNSSSKADTHYHALIYVDVEGPDSFPFKIFGSGEMAGDDSASVRYGYQNTFGSYYDTDSPTVAGVRLFRSGGNFANYTASTYGLIES